MGRHLDGNSKSKRWAEAKRAFFSSVLCDDVLGNERTHTQPQWSRRSHRLNVPDPSSLKRFTCHKVLKNIKIFGAFRGFQITSIQMVKSRQIFYFKIQKFQT